ncbi:MAG: 2-oxoglutarate dehydrogenase, subunit [Fibrobacteres bacterium]|nr:2-oxoglutarate dehydrogenase, subunit [Fibrobacterota bacterium]
MGSIEPNNLSLGFVEALYADYLKDPASVSEDWRGYFRSLDGDAAGADFRARPQLGPAQASAGLFAGTAGTAAPSRNGSSGDHHGIAALQDRADQMVRAYRVRGHLFARIDPLGLPPKGNVADLEPSYFGLSETDLDRTVSGITIQGPDSLTLRQVLERMNNTYCRSVGVQYMHIDSPDVRSWLAARMEGSENRITLTREQQLDILTRLTDAVIFEEFIQKKYLGAKSFSLEGSESLIPLLDLAIEKAGEQKIDEIVLGMAHRGRLNVLANIMGKNPRDIFHEFEDSDPQLQLGRGDVKYHLGYSSDWTAANGHKLHLSLCFNPSHLEFVNPVAQGRLRAKQDRAKDENREKGLTLLIHGDAAFAGEGIIQEILNMSELKGYSTGGTLHVVLNNQIGFTTSPHEGRSTTYATDVAKMLQIPIFHVNGEDAEAVAAVVNLAMDFRMQFKRDVVIDMYGYRRRGHNEADEPAFTQPLLYRTIERRKSVREGYLEHLLKMGGVTREEADRIAAKRTEQLEGELSEARRKEYTRTQEGPSRVWKGFQGGPETGVKEVETGLPAARLTELMDMLTKLPAGFHPHPKIEKILEQRRLAGRGERGLDWASAEALAFASLSMEGYRIRFSGQDAQRGTFSQRHAVLHDILDGKTYMPLRHLSEKQGPLEIYNSPLTENGVLGFEYGYSLDTPKGLTIWEAQFGDFVNVAQPIIDQFIASAEEKWRRLSGLVMLLPHGFEGMGPEHSSARLERFLAMAAEDNFQVMNLSTPAQYFHALRRQMLRQWRKPLIIMTPKSLLRLPAAVSPLEDLTSKGFQRILPDTAARPDKVKSVLMCSGKLFYELDDEREKQKREDIAILRIEQLYPLYPQTLAQALSPFPEGTPVTWVQEEPENMGAWRYLRVRFGERLLGRHPFQGVHRPASSTPATGSASSHKLEQKQLIAKAFGERATEVAAKTLKNTQVEG